MQKQFCTLHPYPAYWILPVYRIDAPLVFVWTFAVVVSSEIHPLIIPGVRISFSKFSNALSAHNWPLTVLIHKQYINVFSLSMRLPKTATNQPGFWVLPSGYYFWNLPLKQRFRKQASLDSCYKPQSKKSHLKVQLWLLTCESVVGSPKTHITHIVHDLVPQKLKNTWEYFLGADPPFPTNIHTNMAILSLISNFQHHHCNQ